MPCFPQPPAPEGAGAGLLPQAATALFAPVLSSFSSSSSLLSLPVLPSPPASVVHSPDAEFSLHTSKSLARRPVLTAGRGVDPGSAEQGTAAGTSQQGNSRAADGYVDS